MIDSAYFTPIAHSEQRNNLERLLRYGRNGLLRYRRYLLQN